MFFTSRHHLIARTSHEITHERGGIEYTDGDQLRLAR